MGILRGSDESGFAKTNNEFLRCADSGLVVARLILHTPMKWRFENALHSTPFVATLVAPSRLAFAANGATFLEPLSA